MSVEDDAIGTEIERIMLLDTATVYTDQGSPDGLYDVVVKAGLKCRVASIGRRQLSATTADRAELAALRLLFWERAYAMPANMQIDVGGERWNVNSDTYTARRGPGGGVIQHNAEMTRAE